MKIVYFSIIMAGLLFMVQSIFAQSEPVPQRNFIHTEGVAEVMGQNDSARIVISIVTDGRSLDAVSSENAVKTEAVLNSLKNMKIENLKLKTSNYRVSPQRDYKARPPKIVNYEVENAIKATLEKFEPAQLSSLVSKIVGTALENGANNINNIQFYIKDKAPLEKEALIRATKEAMSRARTLAKAADLKLKRIASIGTQPAYTPHRPTMVRAATLQTEAAAAAPPIEIGESQVRVQVNLTYEIE